MFPIPSVSASADTATRPAASSPAAHFVAVFFRSLRPRSSSRIFAVVCNIASWTSVRDSLSVSGCVNDLSCPRSSTSYCWGQSTPSTADHRPDERDDSEDERPALDPHADTPYVGGQQTDAQRRVQREDHARCAGERSGLRIQAAAALSFVF